MIEQFWGFRTNRVESGRVRGGWRVVWDLGLYYARGILSSAMSIRMLLSSFNLMRHFPSPISFN